MTIIPQVQYKYLVASTMCIALLHVACRTVVCHTVQVDYLVLRGVLAREYKYLYLGHAENDRFTLF